jgi:hypothetical protein
LSIFLPLFKTFFQTSFCKTYAVPIKHVVLMRNAARTAVASKVEGSKEAGRNNTRKKAVCRISTGTSGRNA